MKRVIMFCLAMLVAGTAGAQMSPRAPGMRSKPAGSMPMPGMAAAIGQVSGSVMVMMPGTGRWKDAKRNQNLPDGAEVRTGRDGSVTMAFSNGSKLRLGPNATFKLEESSPSRISVFLGLGKLEGWIKGLGRRGLFRARTPVAVASVRGTVFAMNMVSASQLDFDLFSGSMDVADNFGNSTTMRPGTRVETNAEKGLGKAKPLPKSAKAPKEPRVKIPKAPKAPKAEGEQAPPDEVPAEDGGDVAPENTPAQEVETVEDTCVEDLTVTPAILCP